MRTLEVEELVRYWKKSNEYEFRNLRSVSVNVRKCIPDTKYRAAFSKKGSYKKNVTVCANLIYSKEDLREALVHELVHVNDDLNWNCDFGNSNELACTEIRAANFAECALETDIDTRRRCVQNVAEASLAPEKSHHVKHMMSKCFSHDISDWHFTRDQM